MGLLLTIALNAALFFYLPKYIPGIKIEDWTRAAIVAVLFVVLNATLGQILYKFSFPFRVFTFGLITVLINTILLMIVDYFIKGFKIDKLSDALIMGGITAIFNGVLNWFL